MVTSNSKFLMLHWWETGTKKQSGMYLSCVSQCIILHGGLGEGAKDAALELQQLRAEAR